MYEYSVLYYTYHIYHCSLTIWFRPISRLYTLLEHDDRAVRVAAGEAIAVTFEIVIADKLSSEATDRDDSDPEHFRPKWFKQLLSLKAKIINQVTALSMEAGSKSNADKKNLNNQRDLFQKVYKYFLVVFCLCCNLLSEISSF